MGTRREVTTLNVVSLDCRKGVCVEEVRVDMAIHEALRSEALVDVRDGKIYTKRDWAW